MQGEAIYKGATRPAMLMGIPLVPLVVLLGGAMLAVMWSGLLVSRWVSLAVAVATLPAMVWMRLVTARDDQRFRQSCLLLKLWLHDRSGGFWRVRGCVRCYTPQLHRGGRDGWHV